ncbi:MAG: cytochrome c [Nitrospinaceae bacterium]|nr:MAG: cytochrome c [Nitrospinaceae bacterium]
MQTQKGAPPENPNLRIKDLEVTAILKDAPQVRVSSFRNQSREKCLTCHDGIEEVSASHPREFGCTVCHGGNGDSVQKTEAHATLIFDPSAGTGKRNPSSLAVVDKSCGQMFCHSGHSQPDRNHIQRVKKSMMATLAGVISGLRYQWAAQSTPDAKYGVYPIADEDGQIPEEWGAVPHLEALPLFSPQDGREQPRLLGKIQAARVSRHVGDRLLRQKCFQCHLDSPGAPGEFRSQGCAACHFTYSKDGLYQGEDPTLSRTETGHPAYHKMTALTPSLICTQCHKTTGSLSKPETGEDSSRSGLFPGKGLTRQDIHFEKGFDCIDCHTQFDIMGDGNLYSKQNQAVEIRCETCHGDSGSLPAAKEVTDPEDRVIRLSQHYNGWTNSVNDRMILSARNRKLTNVKIQNNKLITLGKKSGRAYRTPTIRGGKKAHVIPAHIKKLKCSACHSQWVPECRGCHSLLVSSGSPKSGNQKDILSFTSSPEAISPALMVGPRGKVVPMLGQPSRKLTFIDEQGNPIAALAKNSDFRGQYREWAFTNPHGYSGSNTAYAVAPHSVGKKVRSCASCHLSPKTLGLGDGDLFFGRKPSGKDDQMKPLVRSDIVKHRSVFAPDAKVDVLGKPLAGTSQSGARPFNQKEIARILRVGNCIPCHDSYNDPIYRNIKKSYGFENKIAHHRLRNKILNKK